MRFIETSSIRGIGRRLPPQRQHEQHARNQPQTRERRNEKRRVEGGQPF